MYSLFICDCDSGSVSVQIYVDEDFNTLSQHMIDQGLVQSATVNNTTVTEKPPDAAPKPDDVPNLPPTNVESERKATPEFSAKKYFHKCKFLFTRSCSHWFNSCLI